MVRRSPRSFWHLEDAGEMKTFHRRHVLGSQPQQCLEKHKYGELRTPVLKNEHILRTTEANL